jgi:hypothetical protein
MFSEDREQINIMKHLVPLIGEGKVIPVISNAFRIEEIFHEDDVRDATTL